MQQSDFQGFPSQTLTFLRGIRKNNTKSWFDAHRSDYDQYYVSAGKDFVEAVGPSLAKLAPNIVAQPKINGSIFRINRDVRFSKDKRPYKDHLDFIFWEGDKKRANSAFFMRVSPDGFFVGTGFHMGSSDQLKAFRIAVAEEQSGKELASIVRKLRKQGFEIDGKHYKRIPRDFPDDGPAAEFLLHNSLFVGHQEKANAACDPGAVSNSLVLWKKFAPLHRWLTANL